MLKLLSLFTGPVGVIGSWFSSAFGKIIAVLGALVVLATIGSTVYFSWKATIEASADLRVQTQRQAELIRDREEEIRHLKDLEVLKDRTLKDFSEVVKSTDLQTDSILAWLAQHAPKEGTPEPEASQVLKDTFLKLYGK